jgi:hypothetical protein
MKSIVPLLFVCGLTFFALSGCDSSDDSEDLFLLNPLRVSSSFAFPRDSTVTLAPREVAFEFQFDGGTTEPFQTFEVLSASSASLVSFIQSQGFELEDVRQARIQNQQVTIRLLSPNSDDLGVFNEALLVLTASGRPDEAIAQASFLSGNERTMSAIGDIESFVTSPDFSGKLSLRTQRAAEPVQYRVQIRFNVIITVDATRPFEGTTTLTSEGRDVRSFLQGQGFDVGDVRRARATSVRITESNNSDALSARVRQATVRLRSTGEDGDGVVIGRLTDFGEEVEVGVDVADQITRTGRVELVVELELLDGGNPMTENYSFATEIEIDVEVPQPSATEP